MPVNIEVGLVAMHALAHSIGHPTDGKKIAAPIKRQSISSREPLARQSLVADWFQTRIVALENVRRTHRLDDIRNGLEPDFERNSIACEAFGNELSSSLEVRFRSTVCL
jgi:hypothetical protein